MMNWSFELKIEKKDTTEAFQPIVLELRIESERELNTLAEMCGYNVTIPRHLYLDGSREFNIVQEFLEKLGCAL